MNSSQQITSSGSLKNVTLDDISKLFCMPLSDAATNLGVCTSVLKKKCRDNGLVRWPYRQFLSGKSIEDIKKEAAIERQKQLSDIAKAAGQKIRAPASSLSPSFQLQNKTSGSGGTPTHVMQQQGTKTLQNTHPHDLLNSVLINGRSASSDEFKYGFPSTGLSTVSNKWWGTSGEDGFESDEDDKCQTEETAEGGNNCENQEKDNNNNFDLLGTALLLDVRKRAVDEGREALKKQRTLLL